MRLLLFVCLAGFVSAAPPVQTPSLSGVPNPAHDVFAEILYKNDPFTAGLLLKQWKDRFRAETDPAVYSRVFARATELVDLNDLVHGLRGSGPLRQGIRARPDCTFCQKPTEMMAWTRNNFTYLKEDALHELAHALLNWETLSSDLTRWLEKNGRSQNDWAALEFPDREKAIAPWVEVQFKGLMTENPPDQVALKDYRRRAQALGEFLDGSQNSELWARVDAAESRLSGMEKARRLAAGSSNPELKALFEQAQRASDPGVALQLLGKLFDAAGTHDTVISAAASAREGQEFDDSSRVRVAALLATGLMQETDGTHAGKQLRQFYTEANPLILTVELEDANTIGSELNGRIVFNERMIQQYVKSKGKTLDDLSTDARLLKGLTRELSPLFVHEATHHRQEAWATAQRIQFLGGQNVELEAMQVEAMFIIEKSRIDPAFLSALIEEADSSTLARESLMKAQRMMDGDPWYFREAIKTHHYPGKLSLEGVTWEQLHSRHTLVDQIQAELARRAALPTGDAARLESGPNLPKGFIDQEMWSRQIRIIGTPVLRHLVEINVAAEPMVPGIYEQWKARLEQVNAETEALLKEIKSVEPKRPSSRSVVGVNVPSPNMRK
jgi:hypothetical protein